MIQYVRLLIYLPVYLICQCINPQYLYKSLSYQALSICVHLYQSVSTYL